MPFERVVAGWVTNSGHPSRWVCRTTASRASTLSTFSTGEQTRNETCIHVLSSISHGNIYIKHLPRPLAMNKRKDYFHLRIHTFTWDATACHELLATNFRTEFKSKNMTTPISKFTLGVSLSWDKPVEPNFVSVSIQAGNRNYTNYVNRKCNTIFFSSM